jgi:hypothetical protein
MEVPSPYYSFAQNTTSIPANWTGTFCWSVEVPTSFDRLPSALLVHVWEYNTLPSILAILHTEAVPADGGTVTGKVTPASSAAYLGGFPLSLSLTSGQYHLVLAPGTYALNASATGYQPGNETVVVVANQTVWANLTLRSNSTSIVVPVTPPTNGPGAAGPSSAGFPSLPKVGWAGNPFLPLALGALVGSVVFALRVRHRNDSGEA